MPVATPEESLWANTTTTHHGQLRARQGDDTSRSGKLRQRHARVRHGEVNWSSSATKTFKFEE